MVRAGCVFVAGIHPSRTWTSGSFESVRWNACVHRLDHGLYSHPKKFWGNGVWTHVNSKGKIPSTGNCPQRSIEPATLWQRAQALPTELFRPPELQLWWLHVPMVSRCQCYWYVCLLCRRHWGLGYQNRLTTHPSLTSSSYISVVHHDGWDCCVCYHFINHPTIKVVTFHLCGWCMLGVFLLPAFTCLGHQHQDLLSLCSGMHMCRLSTSVYTLIQKSFLGNGVRSWEPMLTPRGKSLLPEKKLLRRIEPTTLHQGWQRTQHTTNELFWPPTHWKHTFWYHF